METPTTMRSDVENRLKSQAHVEVDEKADAEVTVTSSVPQPDAFPEGGFWGWSTALGAFLIQFSSFGYINAFGVYQDYYVRHYLTRSSPSAIGWIGGAQIFLTFGSGAIVGKLFDRGYFRHLMVASILLNALALYMLSLSQENQYYQIFLTNGVALGAATGITYIPSLGIVGHYFARRRAMVIGFVSSGSALGAIVHPIMLNHLFEGSVGFHNGVRISATLNTVLLLVAFALMRTRLPPKETQKFPVLQWIFKEPKYGFLLVASILTFLGLFFPVFYLQLYAIQHGVRDVDAFYAISVLNAASFIGRLAPNALAHHVIIDNLMTIFLILTGIVTLCMAAVTNIAGTYIFAVFYGFTSGAFIALIPATVSGMAKTPNEVGVRLGVFFGVGSVLGLCATPISGALLTEKYHWIRPILFSGLSLIIAGTQYFLVRAIFTRRQAPSHGS